MTDLKTPLDAIHYVQVLNLDLHVTAVNLLNAVLSVVTLTELMERYVMMVLPYLVACLIVLTINQALYV